MNTKILIGRKVDGVLYMFAATLPERHDFFDRTWDTCKQEDDEIKRYVEARLKRLLARANGC